MIRVSKLGLVMRLYYMLCSFAVMLFSSWEFAIMFVCVGMGGWDGWDRKGGDSNAVFSRVLPWERWIEMVGAWAFITADNL